MYPEERLISGRQVVILIGLASVAGVLGVGLAFTGHGLLAGPVWKAGLDWLALCVFLALNVLLGLWSPRVPWRVLPVVVTGLAVGLPVLALVGGAFLWDGYVGWRDERAYAAVAMSSVVFMAGWMAVSVAWLWVQCRRVSAWRRERGLGVWGNGG